jgi:hypothetical protein
MTPSIWRMAWPAWVLKPMVQPASVQAFHVRLVVCRGRMLIPLVGFLSSMEIVTSTPFGLPDKRTAAEFGFVGRSRDSMTY